MKKEKPSKPYPDFPLFPHSVGQWAKKIRYKTHYFGPWDDWKAALAKYVAERDLLQLGKKPAASSDLLTVESLCNQFLHNRRQAADKGEITERTWKDYETTAKRVAKFFGKPMRVDLLDAEDFAAYRLELGKTRSAASLVGEITRVRAIFNFGAEYGLMKKIAWGGSFKKPSSQTLRKEKASKGKKLFSASELRSVLEIASGQLRAMILLGVNCGIGNTDCARLEWSNLDLNAGWLDFPRPKTGVERKAKLWPQTIDALRAIKKRDQAFVFITKYGNRWDADLTGSAVSKEFRKLLDRAKIHRAGLGFYSLRRTFQTVADDSGDFVAVAHVMGHVDQSMSGIYRQHINAARLEAVSNVVYKWLFADETQPTENPKAT